MNHRRSSRRDFLKVAALSGSCVCLGSQVAWAGPEAAEAPLSLQAAVRKLPAQMKWIQSARTFLVDAYAYPFAPDFEFDARALAETMQDVHANVVRMATSGSYALIQGVRFTPHPALKGRDLLAEVIAACKPRGIRVVPYISAGNTLTWPMLQHDYPQYGQIVRPGGGLYHMPYGAGEVRGTVC